MRLRPRSSTRTDTLFPYTTLFRSLLDRIIEAPKIPRIYQRALRLVGDASNAFMVGDQLQRDIRPAKEAGLRTIYFPGGFRPHWELKEQSVHPDFRVDRLAARSEERCVGKACVNTCKTLLSPSH